MLQSQMLQPYPAACGGVVDSHQETGFSNIAPETSNITHCQTYPFSDKPTLKSTGSLLALFSSDGQRLPTLTLSLSMTLLPRLLFVFHPYQWEHL